MGEVEGHEQWLDDIEARTRIGRPSRRSGIVDLGRARTVALYQRSHSLVRAYDDDAYPTAGRRSDCPVEIGVGRRIDEPVAREEIELL